VKTLLLLEAQMRMVVSRNVCDKVHANEDKEADSEEHQGKQSLQGWLGWDKRTRGWAKGRSVGRSGSVWRNGKHDGGTSGDRARSGENGKARKR